MNFLTISKWELINIVKSRKFVLISFLQLLSFLLLVIFFNNFITSMDTDESQMLTPSLNGFASLDVNDSGLFTLYLTSDIITINNISNTSYEKVKTGKTDGLLIATKGNKTLDPVKSKVYIDYSDPKSTIISSETKLASKKLSIQLLGDLMTNLTNSSNTSTGNISKVTNYIQGELLPLQIIRKVMSAVLLFLPLFMFGNLIIDSIVGEKERKTIEIIITMPISRGQIIIGKSLAVIIVMAMQSAAWIILMMICGFSLNNPVLIYLILILTSLPVVGFASLIATFSKTYKEAGIGTTFVYLAIILFLIVPALTYILNPEDSTSLSTMALVIKLISSEPLKWADIIIPMGLILVFSIITFGLSIWLFNKDSMIFGPRQGFDDIL